MHNDLQILKYTNLFTFHRALANFHGDAVKRSERLQKQLKEKTSK